MGSTNAHRREWLSGKNNSPEGSTVNDKDLLWLLALTKFDKQRHWKMRQGRASFRTQSHLPTRGFAGGSAKGLATVYERTWRQGPTLPDRPE